jgi:hypothetical protein
MKPVKGVSNEVMTDTYCHHQPLDLCLRLDGLLAEPSVAI